MKNGIDFSVQKKKRKIIRKYYFLYIIIFLILIKLSTGVPLSDGAVRQLNNFYSEIHLVVQAEGTQYFLLDNYWGPEPFEILLNGEPLINYPCDLGIGRNNITLKFDELIEDCEYMFYYLENIIEVDLSNFDTSKVTNIDLMFGECYNLETINFGNINTSSVERMSYLFYF